MSTELKERVARRLMEIGTCSEEEAFGYAECAIGEGSGMDYVWIRDILAKEGDADLLRELIDECDRWETDDHESEMDALLYGE